MTSPLVTAAQFRPGSWVGMAGARVWLLADLDPADPVIDQCWELVQAGVAIDTLLQGMAGTQLRPALNIAVVRLDAGQAEIAVRGDAWAHVSTVDGATSEVRAAPGDWENRTVDGYAVVRLHAPEDGLRVGEEPLPLSPGTGVVQATQITVHPGNGRQGVPATGESRDLAGDRGRFDAMFAATGLPEPEPERTAAIPSEWVRGMSMPAGSGAAEPAGSSQADASAGPAASVASATPVAYATPVVSATLPPQHTSAPVGDGSYRSRFEGPSAGTHRPTMPPPTPPPTMQPAPPPISDGAVIVDVSWATVPDDPGPPDRYPYPTPPPYQPPASAYPTPPPAPPAYEPPPSYAAPPAPSYLLASPGYPPAVPPTSSTGSTYSPAPTYAVAPPPAEPAGGGIDPELLKTTKRSAGALAAGPIVGAVRCPDGHPNPPAAQRCRACAKPVPPQTPQPMPRPPLGVLRLSTGEVVTLDKGVILGRAPGPPQGFGPDEPHRIQLSSPDGSISRKHVEVLLNGWLVTVVDLDSTNGTVVTPAGGVSQNLPAGGRTVIENGCVVSLDTTTWFRFEVTS